MKSVWAVLYEIACLEGNLATSLIRTRTPPPDFYLETWSHTHSGAHGAMPEMLT